MSPQGLLNALEAWLSDEIAGKERLVAVLEAQEQALGRGSPEGITEATLRVATEVEADVERARRREMLFARLGAHWKVAASTLTLGSIVERASGGGARIAELRARVRELAAEVLRRNRRITRIVHVHQSIVQETLTALVGSHDPLSETGALFDARM